MNGKFYFVKIQLSDFLLLFLFPNVTEMHLRTDSGDASPDKKRHFF